MDKLWINIRHEWTNYGLTYAMNGQIMEGLRHVRKLWINIRMDKLWKAYAMNGQIMD